MLSLCGWWKSMVTSVKDWRPSCLASSQPFVASSRQCGKEPPECQAAWASSGGSFTAASYGDHTPFEPLPTCHLLLRNLGSWILDPHAVPSASHDRPKPFTPSVHPIDWRARRLAQRLQLLAWSLDNNKVGKPLTCHPRCQQDPKKRRKAKIF